MTPSGIGGYTGGPPSFGDRNPHVGVDEYLQLYPDEPEGLSHFYAEITAMDHAMGVLRQELRQLGIADNTLLWYCSDNGGIKPNSTGGLRGKKATLYEGGVRVPGLIEWPARLREPRATSVPCNTSDIYPTLLEVVGGSLPANQPPLDGISLVPLLDGRMPARPRPMGFWEYPVAGRGTPSAALLRELLAEQQSGDQKPAPPSVDLATPLGRLCIATSWKLVATFDIRAQRTRMAVFALVPTSWTRRHG